MKKQNVAQKALSVLATLIVVATVIPVISFSVLADSTTDRTPSRVTPGSFLEVSLDCTVNQRGSGELIIFNVANISSYAVGLWRIEIPLDRPAELVETWWHDDVEVWITNEKTLVIRGRYTIDVNSVYRGGCTVRYLDYEAQKEEWTNAEDYLLQAHNFLANSTQDDFFPYTFKYRGEQITLENLDDIKELVLFKHPVEFYYRGETYRVTSSYSLPFTRTEVYFRYQNESFCADFTGDISKTLWMGQTDLPEIVFINDLSVEEYFEQERRLEEALNIAREAITR